MNGASSRTNTSAIPRIHFQVLFILYFLSSYSIHPECKESIKMGQTSHKTLGYTLQHARTHRHLRRDLRSASPRTFDSGLRGPRPAQANAPAVGADAHPAAQTP